MRAGAKSGTRSGQSPKKRGGKKTLSFPSIRKWPEHGEFCEKEEEARRSKVRYEKEKGEEEKCGNLCPRPTPLPPPAWTPKSRYPSEGPRSFKDGLRRRRKRTTCTA